MMHGAEGAEASGGGPLPSLTPPNPLKSPLARAAAGLLHKRFRVTVADGRVLIGSFICLDKQGNIILDQTVERYHINGVEKESMLGQVLVPRSQRVACEVEVVPTERPTVERLIHMT